MGQEVATQARLLVDHQRNAPQQILHQRTVRLDGLDELVVHGARGRGSAYCGQTQQQERCDIAGKEMSAHAVRQLCYRPPLNSTSSKLSWCLF